MAKTYTEFVLQQYTPFMSFGRELTSNVTLADHDGRITCCSSWVNPHY